MSDVKYNSNLPYNNEYEYDVISIASSNLFLGDINVGKMFLGEKLVTAAYLGSQKVYGA
jgi:hypothetical protein